MKNFTPSRRSVLQAFLATAALVSTNVAFSQQKWPAKPVRAVVGYAAGGGTDLLLRLIAPDLSANLGQPVVVENRPGAVGNIGTSEVMRAAPDGYTILFSTTTQQTVNPHIIKNSPDMTKGLVPVSVIGRFTFGLIVNSDSEARDLQQLIAMGKSRPGGLTYGSYGSGSLPHLLAELFQQQTGIQMLHVPYKGAAPALQALLSKDIDMMFDPGIAYPYIDSGRLRMLAVATEKRYTRYPQIPTFAESGVNGVEGSSWIGVWVPIGTPPAVISALDKGLSFAASQPQAAKMFSDIGAEALYMGPAEFEQLLTREGKLMTDLIQQRRISAE